MAEIQFKGYKGSYYYGRNNILVIQMQQNKMYIIDI